MEKDKLTYKEQLALKEQECEEYKLQLTSLGYADAMAEQWGSEVE